MFQDFEELEGSKRHKEIQDQKGSGFKSISIILSIIRKCDNIL